MQDESQTNPFDAPSLVKEVAGHLFTFEEKIFGMSLQQLLTDLGVLTGSFSLTGSLPLIPHILVSVFVTLLAMVCVHGKIQGVSLGYWLYLLLRAKMLPRHTIWQSASTQSASSQHKEVPSIQATWIPIDSILKGIGEQCIQRNKTAVVRCWMVYEVEGKNIGLLPEHEQLRVFRRFEHFLTGLEFHLQFLSHTEHIHPLTAPPLLVQKEALSSLSGTPQIQALQRASIQAQEQEMTTCTRTRHFLVVSTSSVEPGLQDPDASSRSVLSAISRLLHMRKTHQVTRSQVLDQLRIRSSIVRKALQQLDMRIWPLEDHELLQLFARCLAPGNAAPPFVPELIETKRSRSLDPRRKGDKPQLQAKIQQQGTSHVRSAQASHVQQRYTKRLQGVHGMFYYTSPNADTRFETGMLAVADLLAPTTITLHPTLIEIQAGQDTRYTQLITVTGYGHHLLCGWIHNLHDVGIPLLISTHIEPNDSRSMIMKLEHALTKLESKRLADQKTLRITNVDQHLEADQIRRVTRALASKKVKIFDVSMTITLHAGSLERLEQRSRYVLSHLRDMQLQARLALHQHDLAWQTCLPAGVDLLQNWVKLTSDVVSTMLPGTSGVVGTPTGVFLGYTGSDTSRHPVYLNPWSTDKKIANPHVVVIGETGQGKSWLGKNLATGFIGLGLADVVVLDKDDDYLPLHETLRGESQRYNLARSCPINLFDLPFGPADVDPDDPADMLAEFFDNTLLTGLTLLVADEETPLTRSEEAYLMTVARATYADKSITSEAIRAHAETTLLPAPTLADFIATMHTLPASSENMRQSLVERLEKAAYLFQGGQTSVSLEKPLTIFSIKELNSKWFALMTFVVQNFLTRHRAIRQDERYLAYIVEEASYLLKHPAGRRYLESGSRGFRKLGIAQITLSQHPRDFLEAGQVVLSNAGTVFYLGMQRTAVEKLHLPEELERLLIESVPGQCVLRISNEYAPLTVWANPVYKAIFTTDPVERREIRRKERERQQQGRAVVS